MQSYILTYSKLYRYLGPQQGGTFVSVAVVSYRGLGRFSARYKCTIIITTIITIIVVIITGSLNNSMKCS